MQNDNFAAPLTDKQLCAGLSRLDEELGNALETEQLELKE